MTMMKKLNQLKYRILFMKLRAQKVWGMRNRLLQATALTATHVWEGAWSSVRILRGLLPLLWRSAYYQVDVGMRHRLDPNARTVWAYVKDEHIFPKDTQ